MPEEKKREGIEEEGKEEKKEKRFAKLSSPLAKVIMMAIIFLILVSISVGAAYYLISKIKPQDWENSSQGMKNIENQKVKIEEKKLPPLGTYKIEDPFKIVLYDKDGNAYNMSVQMTFGIKKDHFDDIHAELEERFSQIKDIIVQTIYSQNPPELMKLKGQTALKIELKNKINQVLMRPIDKVFFENFIISR